MKLKLLTPLRLYLKRSLKRNKIVRFNILCLSLVLLGYNSLNAISADLEIDYSENPVILCRIDDADTMRLLESLKQGYASEVKIEVLLLKKRKKPYSFFGDLLIGDFEISRKAERDFFSELLMLKEIGKESYFNDANEFLNNFFSYEISVPENFRYINDPGIHYFKIRTSLVYRLYIEPFNIFYLLDHKNRSTTGWIVKKIEQVQK